MCPPSEYLWLRGVTPIIDNKSAIIWPFILRSKGLSVFIDGDILTYTSQGFKLESINISNPRTSKQLFILGTWLWKAVYSIFSPDIIVFIITSSTFSKSYWVSCLPIL
mgnify:CR=1 FL=1